jgi:hypothetical protein
MSLTSEENLNNRKVIEKIERNQSVVKKIP